MRANVGRELPVGRFVRGMQAQKTPSADRTRRGADKIELTPTPEYCRPSMASAQTCPVRSAIRQPLTEISPGCCAARNGSLSTSTDHADVRERKIIQMPRRVEHDGRLDPIEIDRAAGHQAQLRLCEHLRVNPEPFASMQPVGDGVGMPPMPTCSVSPSRTSGRMCAAMRASSASGAL